MKFGKSLIRVVELSDPEWGPYWINYKFLKKKINEIVEAQGGCKVIDRGTTSSREISKCSCEVEFFRLLRNELKKVSDFFAATEKMYLIRKKRIWEGFNMLKDPGIIHDKNTWTRLLMACVKFYKDNLLLENFAIMNYCGFSKILKKHDKLTGFLTREAFMRNVMSAQNFTHYPSVLTLIKESETLYLKIQSMESVMPLQAEERLFLDAIRDMNYQASRLQAEENAENVEETKRDKEKSANRNSDTDDNISIDQQLKDPSSRLDAASSLVVDAAVRLSKQAPTANLQTVLSWANEQKTVLDNNSKKRSLDVDTSNFDQITKQLKI